jgi:transposase-like protein
MHEEMTEHLGYEDTSTPDPASGNVRHRTRPKTALTVAAGRVRIDLPRDRARTESPSSCLSTAEFAFINPAWEVSRAAHEPMINFGMHSA